MSARFNIRYPSSNYASGINNETVLLACHSEVKKALGREPTHVETQEISRVFSAYSSENFVGVPRDAIIPTLVSVIMNHLRKLKDKQLDPTDMHRYIKNRMGITAETDQLKDVQSRKEEIVSTGTIGISQIFGSTQPYTIQKYFSPLSLMRQSSIVLDSRYRNLNPNVSNSFSWSMIEGTQTSDTAFNTAIKIRDIVSLKVFQCRIPYQAEADTELQRISIFFEEFSVQSFIAQEGRKYHVMTIPKVNDRWIELDPKHCNDGVFNFSKPITKIDTLTVTFGNPLSVIPFGTDRTTGQATYATTTIITTPSNHGLQSGDRVIFSNFTTGFPLVDSGIISTFNSTSGYVITRLTDTTFSIVLDSTSVYHTLTGAVTATNGSATVTGVGTLFLTELAAGRKIRIIDALGVAQTGTIDHIVDNGTLVLTAVYTGTNPNNAVAYWDTSQTGLSFNVFFNSRRIIMPIEITYIKPEQD